MTDNDLIRMFVPLLVAQLPTLLVCLAAFIVIPLRWKRAPGSSLWALLGFGLLALLCIGGPLVVVKIRLYEMVPGTELARMAWLGWWGICKAVLEGVAYAFLLVAAFSGRSKSRDAMLGSPIPYQAAPPPPPGA